jgi:AraC family L-rhamnose operon regulatory protein RhaS
MEIMELTHSTTAQKSEKLRIEPVQVTTGALSDISLEQNLPDRFRVIFVSEKSGTFDIDGAVFPWVAPCVLCANEQTNIKIQPAPDSTQIQTLTLYFHPRFLHKRLTFENIRQKGMDVEPEIIENRFILRIFTKNSGALLSHLPPEDAARIQTLLASCKTELTEQSTGWWPCRTRSYITELLFLLAQLQESIDRRKNELSQTMTVSSEFKPLLDYVVRSYNTQLSLESLASRFATNRTTLNERFKQETGMTAIAYIIDLRLRIAATLLIDTDLPVTEIAERTGYSDVTHFERLFKRKYTVPPVQFREQQKSSKKNLS